MRRADATYPDFHFASRGGRGPCDKFMVGGQGLEPRTSCL